MISATIKSTLDQYLQERSGLILYSRLKTLLHPPTHPHFVKKKVRLKTLYSIS